MANTIRMEVQLEGKDALRTITALNKGFDNLGDTGTKSVKRIDASLAVLRGTLGAQAIISGLRLTSRAFQQGAKDALDFGKAVAEVNSIVPRTAQETLVLKQELIGLSNEFGDRAQNQARAFYNILSAGITDTTRALNVLEVSNRAAVAGLVDVDTAARGLISVTNSYTDGSLNAAQAADILFTAVREGRTTFGELADTVGRVSSIAATANVAFSEVAGTLAFVTKSGIQTDEAVIGLRQLFTSIIGPTDEVRKRARDLGIEFSATALETKGLGGFLTELRTATKGNVATIRELFPNVRAFNIAVKVAGGDVADFNRILGETANATGATDKALQVITDSAGFQFDKLTNQLSNFPTAVLTNFEEPIADALKAVNQFVSTQGILLIPDAINIVIDSFEGLLTTGEQVSDFFDSIGKAASDTVNFFSGFNNLFDTEDVANDISKLKEQLKELEDLGQIGPEGSERQEALDKQISQIKELIRVREDQRDVFQQADIADAQIANAELQRREERTKKIEEFRQKLADARAKEVEDQKKRLAEQEENDRASAQKRIEDALAGEKNKFNALQELRAAQAEQENEIEEGRKIAQQLKNEEEFLFLEENLGREATLRELARIKELENETKRQEALKKLRDKARKEEQAGILQLRKFEDLTNREKIAAQKATLGAIAGLTQSTNGALFAIGKAASLSLAGINVAEGVTKALSAFPPPFNFAAAAAVGAAGAIQIGKIAAAKPPSAGSFQSGGIVEGSSQTGDQLTANVNAGEVIFNRRQQQNLFKAVDSGNLGGGNNITINNPIFMNEEMVDDVIDQINDRVEFGNKRLTASEVA